MAILTIMQSSNGNEDGFLGLRKTRSVHGFFRQVLIDFLFGGLALMNRNINTVVESMKGSRMSSTGFVTFKSLSAATAASRVPLSHDPDVLITSVAPDPREIIWENAHVNKSYSDGRAVTANFCTGLGALLWSTVVASIQTWANVEHLIEVPGFAWLESVRGGNLTTFVNGYLPVVALLTIIGILPKIFESIAMKFESRKTKTDVQISILGRYFYYQVSHLCPLNSAKQGFRTIILKCSCRSQIFILQSQPVQFGQPFPRLSTIQALYLKFWEDLYQLWWDSLLVCL